MSAQALAIGSEKNDELTGVPSGVESMPQVLMPTTAPAHRAVDRRGDVERPIPSVVDSAWPVWQVALVV